jgi:surface polysaccharide O-acyltransferase-like enzyme
MLLEGPLYYHLWFLYVLIGLYLLSPILGIYLRHATQRNVGYLLGLWLALVSVLPAMEALLGIDTYFSPGSSNALSVYLGIFIIGYMLRDVSPRPNELVLLILLFFFAFAVTALGTYYLTLRNGGVFEEVLYEYSSLNVVAMSVSVYLIGKSRLPRSFSLERRCVAIREIAASVPGVYLLHAMVIAVFRQGLLSFTLSPYSFHPALGVPIFRVGRLPRVPSSSPHHQASSAHPAYGAVKLRVL